MLLFVIRHGDPIYNPDTLTPLGKLQAQALAKRFSIHGLDRIYSSPLGRARETAQPTADVLKLPVEIEEWTSEQLACDDFGLIYPNGKWGWIFNQPTHEFLQDGDADLNHQNWDQAKTMQVLPDAKKRYERVTAASDEFLEKLGYRREGTGVYRIIKPSEERIALFCHQGFSMIWFPVLLGIVPHIFWSSFDINHAGVSVFEFKNYESGFTSPRCVSLSDNSHLLRDGLPYKHQNYLPL